MNYYKVWPASASYKAKQPLTYASSQHLQTGQLVSVPLRQKIVAGVVTGYTKPPDFSTKNIDIIHDLPVLPKKLIELANWMANYYSSGIGAATKQIISANNLKKPNQNTTNRPKKEAVELPPLTDDQKNAVDQITSQGTYILHGETGTGKTRVYLELAKKSLANKKSVVILTPEIGLITQLADIFQQQLEEKVVIIHSDLTVVQKRQVWQKILTSKKPLVIIGPRSALFAPIKKLGLVVIDECHDSSYKQSDAPHYRANTVAAKLSMLHGCPLVLGSATPGIDDYFLARQRHRPIIRMHQLATQTQEKSIETQIIDLKDRLHFRNSKYLSNELIEAIQTSLDNNEQSLLFLNRRGTARVVICGACGWLAECPDCGLALTYHGDKHKLNCHVCGYNQPVISACPSCSSTEIQFRSIGSKAIESEVQRLFPGAVIRRFDSDNPKSERLEKIYNQIKHKQVDVIIGTQVVGKGLDLPRLSVVGIVVADTNLYLPDYMSDERTYQLIRQVVGRVGRGHRSGKVVVQTYAPNNSVIRNALAGMYENFYKQEIIQRKNYKFPPIRHMLKLEISRASAEAAKSAANKTKQALQESRLSLDISGPSPCFHEKRRNRYHWQLIVKSPARSDLLAAIELVPPDWTKELDPISLL